MTLAPPKEMGGAGGNGTNPEQLFAAGLLGLLHGRDEGRAGRRRRPAGGRRSVRRLIGPIPAGFGIQVAMRISFRPSMDALRRSGPRGRRRAQGLPVLNATGNIDVTLTVV